MSIALSSEEILYGYYDNIKHMVSSIAAGFEHPIDALEAAESYIAGGSTERIEFGESNLPKGHEFVPDTWYKGSFPNPYGDFFSVQAHILEAGDFELISTIDADGKVTYLTDPYGRAPFEVGDIVLRACKEEFDQETHGNWVVFKLSNVNEMHQTDFKLKQVQELQI
ncbi:hypothetical protein HYV31_00350 [candidate division WWE3 bacterium]|nr:hypothetical protein [candidate division WWE3 bacterium]